LSRRVDRACHKQATEYFRAFWEVGLVYAQLRSSCDCLGWLDHMIDQACGGSRGSRDRLILKFWTARKRQNGWTFNRSGSG